MHRPAGILPACLAVAFLIVLAVLSACGDDDAGSSSDETPGTSSTPFALGSTLTIRGQQVTLPDGVAYYNQKLECQREETANTAACESDFRMLIRGESYILFDPAVPRVVARRIASADEADFRPLLGLISGTSSAATSSPSPAP